MWVLWGAGQGVHCPPPSLQDSEINFCQAQPKSQFELGCSWFYSQLLRWSGKPAGRNSTFQAKFGLDLKSKVVYLNDETLEIFLDLNPIGHVGHLTLF